MRSQPAPKKSKRKPGAAARANQISSDRLVRVVENHLKSVNEISDLTTISNAINRELGLPWKRFSPKYGKLKTFLQSNKRAFRYVSDREIWRAAAWAEAKERRRKRRERRRPSKGGARLRRGPRPRPRTRARAAVADLAVAVAAVGVGVPWRSGCSSLRWPWQSSLLAPRANATGCAGSSSQQAGRVQCLGARSLPCWRGSRR